MKIKLKRRNQRGQSIVEYALLVTLLAIACLFAMQLLGVSLVAAFNHAATKISAAAAE